ncbi:MAG: 3-hydroxyacyl-CoA dehydrogenase/enoyl-CoA hydratase family protein [Deltaproteobacteria bacterium]|nr:3-hydroxyacyl-CoA dehydrogenase/enoyl-CoA hydratase family protein [Deltaproteobacteria bacterium]
MSFNIRRATVIGSGVMGGGIAAHLANAGLPVYLIDIAPNKLTPEEEAKGLTLDSPAVKNRIVASGLEAVKKSKPAALFTPGYLDRITIGNMEDNFNWVGESDWIIEVIIEKLEIKKQLMARIESVRQPRAIVSTNTSGLLVNNICEDCSADFKEHFLGTHFFNPARYLKLFEIIPTPETSREILDYMAYFGEKVLGKGVVFCKDTPNFIANRMVSVTGCFVIDYAAKNGYTVEEVDYLTGPIIGHPKTGTFRLNDLVGNDIAAHVANNLYPLIPHDEQREILKSPDVTRVMDTMLEQGRLGNKAQQGFYKKVTTPDGKRDFEVVDLATLTYRAQTKENFPSVEAAKKVKPLAKRFAQLVTADDRAGKFYRATILQALSYAGMRVPEISDDIVNVDKAVRWGFVHEMGPFEIWDALGVKAAAEMMEQDGLPVPGWVKDMLAAGCETFYKREGTKSLYYDLATKGYLEIPADPNIMILKDLKDQDKIIRRNAGACLIDLGDGVAGLEFQTKANSLDGDVIQMIKESVQEAEKNFRGLVIGNQGQNFSVGANIFQILMASEPKQWEVLEKVVKELQDVIMSMRYSSIPVVAAPFGMALGGGCEVCMGADAICAAGETYMGLVEVGVGVIPAGTGCKELLRRIVAPAMATPDVDPLPFLQRVLETIAMAKVSASAQDARAIGFLSPSDRVVMNGDHLIAEAKKMVIHMSEAGYRPPIQGKNIYALGRRGLAAAQLSGYMMSEGHFISDHDRLIVDKLGYVVAGGALSSPQWVTEQYILDLEREAFVSLCCEEKTKDRVRYLLMNNKPLRN